MTRLFKGNHVNVPIPNRCNSAVNCTLTHSAKISVVTVQSAVPPRAQPNQYVVQHSTTQKQPQKKTSTTSTTTMQTRPHRTHRLVLFLK